MKKVLVIGSINMDIVAATPRIPQPGETIIGRGWVTIPGGKGANQAVAAALAGGDVWMIGKIGSDGFGKTLRQNLEKSGVRTEMVGEIAEAPTGIALISVDNRGANSIIVVPGANHGLTPADLTQCEEAFHNSPIVLIQLEIPWETAARAIRLAMRHQCLVILDPSPAPDGFTNAGWLEGVGIATPNQVEAEMITGVKVDDLSSARKAASILREMGVETAVIKLGSEGVLVHHDRRFDHFPGHRVKTVDTTAAGDTFAGALAAALAEDRPLRDAVRFANAAGALSTTRVGAQSSVPTRREIEEFLAADG